MNMEPVNTAAVSTAPDFAGVLRRRLDHVPGKVLAAELAYDESHIGKFLNGTAALSLAHVSKLMEVARVKPVDASRTTVNVDELRFLRSLYARVQSQAPHLLNEEET